ncbi:hypothetical protein H671_3g10769 [Cricetulus griseus]|nr:hypothetical protein H671_3g10769 [Cricetulus griseus]
MVLTGRIGLGEMLFSKIFHRCYSSIGTGLEKAYTSMLLARHLQGLELHFILGRVFPVAAEVQHSAALVHSHFRRTSGA